MGNGHKLQLRRFRLGTRKRIVQEAAGGLGQVIREGGTSVLGGSKGLSLRLGGKAMAAPIWCSRESCLEWEVGLGTSRAPLHCHLCESVTIRDPAAALFQLPALGGFWVHEGFACTRAMYECCDLASLETMLRTM